MIRRRAALVAAAVTVLLATTAGSARAAREPVVATRGDPVCVVLLRSIVVCPLSGL
jgi:hypothetical protein